MILYSGTLAEFGNNVFAGEMAEILERAFHEHGISGGSKSEIRAWQSSLKEVAYALCEKGNLPPDLDVAVEYKIPLTEKRIDFIVGGKDREDKGSAVIIELKQWEKAEKTDKPDMVISFVGGGNRLLPHPSYQAESYCRTIEDYNVAVRRKNVGLYPCCYLHNMAKKDAGDLLDDRYSELLRSAPAFLMGQGRNLGEFVHSHVQRGSKGETIDDIEHGKIRPSRSLQNALRDMLKGRNYFHLLDEQKVAYECILSEIEKHPGEKLTFVVEGGAGTGKSVIAINLLARFISSGKMAAYVSKNSAPRNVYKAKLQGEMKKKSIDALFLGSGSFVDQKENFFEATLCDEAHRLNEKSGMFHNKGENQIREIIHASRVSIFFIDEGQRVTSSDFGSIERIKEAAALEGSHLFMGEDYRLISQFRCGGSGNFITFLDELIYDKKPLVRMPLGFDFKIYDDPCQMRDDLRIINAENNSARMLSGYTYNWVSDDDPSLYDIAIEGTSFKAQWNFTSTKTWAIDLDSFEQVGCIHTSQGLEFDAVGVIIGKNLIARDGITLTDMSKKAKTDKSLNGLKNKPEIADTIIRNTYKTLLTRGQKSCYVYIEDEGLRQKAKKLLSLYGI